MPYYTLGRPPTGQPGGRRDDQVGAGQHQVAERCGHTEHHEPRRRPVVRPAEPRRHQHAEHQRHRMSDVGEVTADSTTAAPTARHQPIQTGRQRRGIAAVRAPSTAAAP